MSDQENDSGPDGIELLTPWEGTYYAGILHMWEYSFAKAIDTETNQVGWICRVELYGDNFLSDRATEQDEEGDFPKIFKTGFVGYSKLCSSRQQAQEDAESKADSLSKRIYDAGNEDEDS